MEEAPPPSEHVLRPHHIALLTIVMMAFKDLEIKKFPTAFALHIHRVLLNEIAEVRPASTEYTETLPERQGRNTEIIYRAHV